MLSRPGFAADIWVTVFAPGNTPAPVVARLNRELNQIAASPEVKALLEPDGATPMALSPADLARRVRDDLAIWKKIAVEKKILAD